MGVAPGRLLRKLDESGGTQLNSQADDVSIRWAYGSYEDPLPGDSDGWRSLYLRIIEVAPYLDTVELPTFSDPGITLVLKRSFRMDTFSEGRWRGTKYTRGTGKVTPARQGRLIRHHFENQKNLALLHLILPQNTVDLVAAEVPKAGTTLRRFLSDVPFLDDTLLTNLMFSVVAALGDGAGGEKGGEGPVYRIHRSQESLYPLEDAGQCGGS